MGLNVIFNDYNYNLLPKQLESFEQYVKIVQWGRKNPIEFC